MGNKTFCSSKSNDSFEEDKNDAAKKKVFFIFFKIQYKYLFRFALSATPIPSNVLQQLKPFLFKKRQF